MLVLKRWAALAAAVIPGLLIGGAALGGSGTAFSLADGVSAVGDAGHGQHRLVP